MYLLRKASIGNPGIVGRASETFTVVFVDGSETVFEVSPFTDMDKSLVARKNIFMEFIDGGCAER